MHVSGITLFAAAILPTATLLVQIEFVKIFRGYPSNVSS